MRRGIKRGLTGRPPAHASSETEIVKIAYAKKNQTKSHKVPVLTPSLHTLPARPKRRRRRRLRRRRTRDRECSACCASRWWRVMGLTWVLRPTCHNSLRLGPLSPAARPRPSPSCPRKRPSKRLGTKRRCTRARGKGKCAQPLPCLHTRGQLAPPYPALPAPLHRAPGVRTSGTAPAANLMLSRTARLCLLGGGNGISKTGNALSSWCRSS